MIPTAPNFKEVKNDPLEEFPSVEPLDQNQEIPKIPTGGIEIPREIVPDTTTFIFAEIMPEPVGGWETFFGSLRKNLKYPKPAQRVGTTGKVFVEFTVSKTGELDNLKILKGLGDGCDEEAMRVIKLTSGIQESSVAGP